MNLLQDTQHLLAQIRSQLVARYPIGCYARNEASPNSFD